MPKVDGERGVSAGQDGDEVPFERLDCTFRRIHTVVVRFHQLELAFVLGEKLFDMLCRLIVHDVELGFKSFRF